MIKKKCVNLLIPTEESPTKGDTAIYSSHAFEMVPAQFKQPSYPGVFFGFANDDFASRCQ